MSLRAKLNGVAKQDSSAAAARAKAAIRRLVLDAIGRERAHVFDAFAGSGQMHDAVWHAAASCTGCDLRFFRDPRRAFVADNRRVLRNIGLAQFSIFDLDAYGSPWEQVIIIASRRRLAEGESLGLVLTEGAGMKMKFGDLPLALTQLSGVRGQPGVARQQDAIIDRAILRAAAMMGGAVRQRWQADGRTGSAMRYIGLVIRGEMSGSLTTAALRSDQAAVQCGRTGPPCDQDGD